jgi:hypothetical protein
MPEMTGDELTAEPARVADAPGEADVDPGPEDWLTAVTRIG